MIFDIIGLVLMSEWPIYVLRLVSALGPVTLMIYLVCMMPASRRRTEVALRLWFVYFFDTCSSACLLLRKDIMHVVSANRILNMANVNISSNQDFSHTTLKKALQCLNLDRLLPVLH